MIRRRNSDSQRRSVTSGMTATRRKKQPVTSTEGAAPSNYLTRLHQAPIAVASDGTLVVNAAHVIDGAPEVIIRNALGLGSEIFLGIALTNKRKMSLVLKHLDDAMAEAVAGTASGFATSVAVSSSNLVSDREVVGRLRPRKDRRTASSRSR